MSKNDITGANLQTKAATENYRSGWDLIYAKKQAESESESGLNAETKTEQPVVELGVTTTTT